MFDRPPLKFLHPNFGKTAAKQSGLKSAHLIDQVDANLARRFAWNQTFTLSVFAGQFAGTTNGFSLFASALFRWLFIEIPQFHFTEYTFTLQLFLQSAEGLVNIVVTYDDLHGLFPFFRFIFRDLVCALISNLSATNEALGTQQGTDCVWFTQPVGFCPALICPANPEVLLFQTGHMAHFAPLAGFELAI